MEETAMQDVNKVQMTGRIAALQPFPLARIDRVRSQPKFLRHCGHRDS